MSPSITDWLTELGLEQYAGLLVENEVDLKLSAKANRDDGAIFVVELMYGGVFQISGVTKTPPGAAPGIGQHTDEVLREYGFSDTEIRQFRSAKAVQ